MEKSVLLFNLHNLENVLQRNLRTGMARECIFRASGGTRFKNFCQPWWWKGGGGTPRYNQSAQKKSGYVTVISKIEHCLEDHYFYFYSEEMERNVSKFILSEGDTALFDICHILNTTAWPHTYKSV